MSPAEQPVMSKTELAFRTKLKSDFEFYAPKALKIRPKAGALVPFTLNKAQRYLHLVAEKQILEKGRVRIIVLKGRQQGISTYIEGRFYWRVTHRKGVGAFILTHEDKATETLFDMAQRYHDNCLDQVRPVTGAQSAKALNFSALDSGYKVGTAGSKAVGRGSANQYFHGCLAAGTQIVDGATNKLIPIEDYRVGDLVITHTGIDAPVSFISTQEKACLEVNFNEDGWQKPLVATPEHRFWTKEGWKKLGEMVSGDVIGFPHSSFYPASVETEFSDGYAWNKIINMKDVGLKTVYDFEVDHDDHSYCTIHGAAKNSEVAFWPHADTHAMGVMQGIPLMDGTEIFLESTANGPGNFFHAQWQLAERGESDYIAVFLPWYWQDEYTLPCDDEFELTTEEFELLNLFKKDGLTAEHLNWRRMKTGELSTSGEDGDWRFKQEYPFTSAEAFQTSGEESLIDPKFVLAARKAEKPMSGAHVVGVDPARYGKDRTAIIHRNGRKAYGSVAYRKKSVMEVAGICVRILTDAVTGNPTDVDMMFIDVGGLGAGVYDRLEELGYAEDGRIMAVNSANRALQDDRYTNKRAEMGVNMRDWFEMPGGVDIEDLDVLQADICGPRYSYDSSGRYVIESKKDMKKRGMESPDFFDSLGLTLAEPVAPPNLKKRRAQANIQTVDYQV